MSDVAHDPADLPAEIAETYERFVTALRTGDLEAASRIAPSVPLSAGEPGQETGPLHPSAFQTDERNHRLLAWYVRGEGTLLRSGVGWYVVATGEQGCQIVEAGLKPID